MTVDPGGYVWSIYQIKFLRVVPDDAGYVWTDIAVQASGPDIVYNPTCANRKWLDRQGPRVKFNAPPWLGRQQFGPGVLRARLIAIVVSSPAAAYFRC